MLLLVTEKLFCPRLAVWLAATAFLWSLSAGTINAAALSQISNFNMVSASRIISGKFAPDDRYPYAVSMHRQGRQHSCGGSLIAPNLILSAAHCSGNYFGQVYINYFNLSDSAPQGQEIFDILHEFIHPRYNYIDYPHDFMVVMIDGNSSIPPVKLNRNSAIPRDNEALTVIGWGRTDTQGNYTPSEVLKEAEVTSFSQSDCRDYWLASAHQVTDDMMCAMTKTGINCRGDSGSPLLVLGRNASDDIQIGLVSWGPLQCDLPNTPSVYSRVTDQIDWIDSIICRHSSEPPGNLDCSSYMNGTTADNQFSKSNTTEIGQVRVSVVLNLDGRPYETGFYIQDERGDEVYRINPGTYAPGTNRTIETVVLDADQKYDIVLLDAANDGFCCENGTGSYDVYLEENKHLLLSGDGDFETFTRASFVTSNRGGRFESAKLAGEFPILLRFETKLSPIKLAWTLFQVDTDNRPIVASVEPGTYLGNHIVEDEIILGVQGGLYSLSFTDPDNIHRFAVFVGGTSIENSTAVASGYGSTTVTFQALLPEDTFLFAVASAKHVTLELNFDANPSEVGWFLVVNGEDNVTGVNSNKIDKELVTFGPREAYWHGLANKQVVEHIPLPPRTTGLEVSLVVYDAGGDGLCCKHGKGSLVLYIDNDTVVVNDFMDERYTIKVYPRPRLNPSSCSADITYPLALTMFSLAMLMLYIA